MVCVSAQPRRVFADPEITLGGWTRGKAGNRDWSNLPCDINPRCDLTSDRGATANCHRGLSGSFRQTVAVGTPTADNREDFSFAVIGSRNVNHCLSPFQLMERTLRRRLALLV